MLEIAIGVFKADMLAIGIPILGLTFDNSPATMVDEDANKFSELAKSVVFF